MRAYLIAIAVFGIGMWLVQVLPSAAIAVQVFGIGKAISRAQWELLLEVSTFTAMAAAVGFAIVRCRSVLRALCAVPIAVFITLLFPSRWGIWFSEYFHSVTVNVMAVGLLFASAGALAGWSISRFFKHRSPHA